MYKVVCTYIMDNEGQASWFIGKGIHFENGVVDQDVRQIDLLDARKLQYEWSNDEDDPKTFEQWLTDNNMTQEGEDLDTVS
jgi:hypothetical protein